MIVEERVRQLEEEGFDAERDDGYVEGQLLEVAHELVDECYPLQGPGEPEHVMDCNGRSLIAKHVGSPAGEMRMLVIAGALIAAEIDRRLRLAP